MAPAVGRDEGRMIARMMGYRRSHVKGKAPRQDDARMIAQ